jgi:hypothetical protein
MRTTYGKNLCASGGHNNGPPQDSKMSHTMALVTTTGANGNESTIDDNGMSPLGQGINSTATSTSP